MILDENRSIAVTNRTDSQVVDKKSIAQRRLEAVFGRHTFFSCSTGLFIVEPTSDPKRPERTLVRRVRLATWADDEHKNLKPIKSTPKAKLIKVG